MQASANGTVTVSPAANESVTVLLPANGALQPGDRVRVVAQGSGSWTLAQNTQQFVDTSSLPGNAVPGATWTARVVDAAAPDQPWSGTASSADGVRLAAIANPGGVYVSQDGGATWTRTTLPSSGWTQVLMSSDGSRLAAVGGGSLYVSSDGGQSWSQRGTTVYWTAVTMSDDGQRIVGVGGGSVQRSTDGGATFTAVAGTANTGWLAIAGSTDGSRLVATASPYAGDPARQGVYVSGDGGLTWTRRVGDGNWTHAAASGSGNRMAVLDNGGNPWISDDAGATWTARFSYSGWSGLAVSRDASVVVAQEPRNDAYGHHGYVFISTTGGNDPWTWTAADLNLTWRGIALSADGNRMVAADHGVDGSAGGRVYTTSGNRTSIGTLGSIGGTGGQQVEVTYQGNGRFTVSNAVGGAFTIR